MNHLLDHDHTELDLVLDDAVSAVIDGAIERACDSYAGKIAARFPPLHSHGCVRASSE